MSASDIDAFVVAIQWTVLLSTGVGLLFGVFFGWMWREIADDRLQPDECGCVVGDQPVRVRMGSRVHLRNETQTRS